MNKQVESMECIKGYCTLREIFTFDGRGPTYFNLRKCHLTCLLPTKLIPALELQKHRWNITFRVPAEMHKLQSIHFADAYLAKHQSKWQLCNKQGWFLSTCVLVSMGAASAAGWWLACVPAAMCPPATATRRPSTLQSLPINHPSQLFFNGPSKLQFQRNLTKILGALLSEFKRKRPVLELDVKCIPYEVWRHNPHWSTSHTVTDSFTPFFCIVL